MSGPVFPSSPAAPGGPQAGLRTVVVTGPESTGKSTLSAALAAALATRWRPEAARAYLEHLRRPYEEPDLVQIAAMQAAQEQALAADAARWLVLDTDGLVLQVWSEARYGRCDHRILAGIAAARPALYLLTDTDLDWEPDPLREHPDPADRRRFWHQYRDAVIGSGVPWALVSGGEAERLETALAAIRRVEASFV